jgi:hypothetical protein
LVNMTNVRGGNTIVEGTRLGRKVRQRFSSLSPSIEPLTSALGVSLTIGGKYA